MISEKDYHLRGWDVLPCFTPGIQLPLSLVDEMEKHPESAGKSSWGTRNVLLSLVLSTRPKIVLEVGAHIGSASVVIGAALKANAFGKLFCLEPQEHYFNLLSNFVAKADIEDYVVPLKMFSTSPDLNKVIGEKADIIFLDANHSYSNAKKDLQLCDAIIAENGLIILDDVGLGHSEKIDPEGRGGVRKALLDYCEGREDLKVILFEPPFWLNPCGMALVCKQSNKF